jgi:hypothetical protein
MGSVGLVASVALGLVFVVAGASKVARGVEWHVQARELGAPRVLAPIVPLVPWWEMVIGALLIVGLFAPWPALAAAATLMAFTGLILMQLRRGRHPQCACFGAWSAAPLGPRHVWRNVGFLVLAAAATALG